MLNAVILMVSLRMRLRGSRTISSDIAAIPPNPPKKNKKSSSDEKRLISRVSRMSSPEIPDITVKNLKKDLTFVFGCAKRME